VILIYVGYMGHQVTLACAFNPVSNADGLIIPEVLPVSDTGVLVGVISEVRHDEEVI
jgi:hypothetical protein